MCQLGELLSMEMSIVFIVVALYAILQVFRFIFADADFTLLWAASFGKKPGNLTSD